MNADADIPVPGASADDRLLVTLVLAGLFHLIVILGVTFAAPDPDPGIVPTLEVLLVGDRVPDTPRNDEAAYLAQRSQQGRGNTADRMTNVPPAENAPLSQPGEAEGDLASPSMAGPAGGDESVLAAAPGRAARYLADAADPAATVATLPRQLRAGEQTLLPATGEDAELRLRGPQQRHLHVTASTREAATAVYRDAWKRRVERVGTLNFPNEARRRQLSGNPVIEVVMSSGGRLLSARVRRTSGHAELDQAALAILRLAAPFDAFPGELAARYDTIGWADEWQFVGGRLTGTAAEPAARAR